MWRSVKSGRWSCKRRTLGSRDKSTNLNVDHRPARNYGALPAVGGGEPETQCLPAEALRFANLGFDFPAFAYGYFDGDGVTVKRTVMGVANEGFELNDVLNFG